MAFGARKVFPNDLRPRVAIGVNLPFSAPGVFEPNYQTKQAIKNNLINYFLTNPGEIIQNPTFGAGLRNFIFTQIEQENLINSLFEIAFRFCYIINIIGFLTNCQGCFLFSLCSLLHPLRVL